MSTLVFANRAQTTLAGSLTSGATTATLATGSGALFPALTGGQYFVMTFADAATQTIVEIVWVTAISGDTITIQRAKEGTLALTWNVGDVAGNWLTAGQMTALNQINGAAGGDLTGNYPNPTIAAGAVTGSKIAAGAVATSNIADHAVTNVKMAQAPALTLKGNSTGSTADVQDVSQGQVEVLLGFSTAGATSPTMPGAGAAAGTVGSSGYYYEPSGGPSPRLVQWAYIQLEDYGSSSSTYVPWALPIAFPHGPVGFRGAVNCSIANGQGGNSRLAIAMIESWSTTVVNFQCHNTQTGGTLCAFYVEVWGF